MGISIKRAETEALARRLALRRGESLTNAIHNAIVKDLKSTEPTEAEQAQIDADLERLFAEIASWGPGNGRSREEIEAEMYGEFGEPI